MPKDCFDTKKLGFVYDTLPPTPVLQQREKPIYAVFFNVHIPDLQKKSYTIHVFVQLKSDTEPAPLPDLLVNFNDDERYAGWTAIFGGRGPDCENCVRGRRVNYYVELNDALHNLDVCVHDVRLDVVLFDEMGERFDQENAPGVPVPKIRGPWFTKKDHLTCKTENVEYNGEAYMVQKYLAKFGWYDGKLDGWFGDLTHEAVKEFQKMMGMEVNGIACMTTKDCMMRPRHDGFKDKVWQEVDDEKKTERAPANMMRNYPKGATVLYHIGTSPIYLNRESVEHDIVAAFNTWNDLSDSSEVVFERTENLEVAQVRVQWSNTSPRNDRRFDGRGGMLA